MKHFETRKPVSRRFALATVGAVIAASTCLAIAAEAKPVKIVSHRHPALEFYTEKMVEAAPAGVEVDRSLMPIDKMFELDTITFSSKSDAVDITYANDTALQRFAKNGWLEPLDDLWEKYKDEFNLDDFPEGVMNSMKYDGHIYSMPCLTNTMFFFYRADMYADKGAQPPATFKDYLRLAKEFNAPAHSGTILSMKPVDAALNEAHWYMNAIGDGWFDADWKPIFNNAKGVEAIETLKQVAQYAPSGFTSHANDESSINLQQGLAVMGLQWITRAASMDDPAKSRVVGKIEWAPPPGGGQRIANDGYAISRFSSQDKEMLFKMIATATNQKNMKEISSRIVPPRKSLLNDPELQKKYRYYPAAVKSLELGKPYPPLPEFMEVGDIITRRVNQAVTGETPVKEALDTAAKETESLLRKRGYYK